MVAQLYCDACLKEDENRSVLFLCVCIRYTTSCKLPWKAADSGAFLHLGRFRVPSATLLGYEPLSQIVFG